MSTPAGNSKNTGVALAFVAHGFTELWKSDGSEAVFQELSTMDRDTLQALLMVMIGARAQR